MRPVAGFRRTVGLAASSEDVYLNCGQPSAADALVGLYSRHFAPLEDDHPSNARIVGFPFDTSPSALRRAAPLELGAFLAAGARPIVFTLGSFAVEASGSFYEESLAAARRLGRRAILLTGPRHADRFSSLADGDAFATAYAPHDILFPYAAAVVHHGGMGTTAEALRSGLPQVVVPFFGDQPDHAARIERLDVGRMIAPKDYDATRAAAALATVLAPEMVDRAARLVKRLAHEDGADEVAAMVETMLTPRSRLAS